MNDNRLKAMAWWNQLTPDEKLKYSPTPDSLTGLLIERIFFDKNRIDEKFNSYCLKYDKIASSKIEKKSGKPFANKKKIATAIGITIHPITNREAYILEDKTIVEVVKTNKVDKYVLHRKDPFTDMELEPFVSSCPRIIAGYYLATIQNTHDIISVEKNGSPMMLEELRVILKNFSSDLGV